MLPQFTAVNGMKIQTDAGEATFRVREVLSADEDPRIPHDAVCIEYEVITGDLGRVGRLQIRKDSAKDVETLIKTIRRATPRIVASGPGEVIYL